MLKTNKQKNSQSIFLQIVAHKNGSQIIVHFTGTI